MITDANSHLGSIYDVEAYEHWSKHGEILERVVERYFSLRTWIDRHIVVAFPQGPHINDNDCIAHFAKQHADKVAPFLLLDPTKSSALDDIDRFIDMGAKGVHLAPIYQKFKPDEEVYFPIYEKLQKKGLPVIWFQGSSFEAVDGPMEWANPVLLDKVARHHPELRMMIAHFGSPWFREVIALIKKHKHVYTEMSALCFRTWALYSAMIETVQYNADEKVFFGSEFPMMTPDESREALYDICSFGEGANLPRVPKDVVQKIMTRDVYALLGVS